MAVTRYPMMASQGSYTFFCPTITSAGLVSITIENAGKQVIVADVGEQGNRFNECFIRMAVVVSTPTPGNTHFRVQAALPVNHQHDLTGLALITS
jgi:hypothetical protein